MHAADGTVIVSMGPSYGEWLPYDKIPPVMRDAMVAVEDRRFRSHIGIDPIGVMRAVKLAFVNRGTDRRFQGASTITQQVARTIFLSNKYDVGRKSREALLALAMERKFSKDQILELYLNKVYFGGGAYGIDAAARKFFGHGADTLTLSEGSGDRRPGQGAVALLADRRCRGRRGRAGVVIELMQETGKITAAEAATADPKSVALAPEPKQNSVRYFTDWALPQLELLIDETSRPLEVWTTLDLNMQRDADAAIRANAPKNAQGALVAIDRDGAVRAMVGGKDYVSSIYNRATQAVRQPGSAFKLFVYLAALEAGHKPEDTLVDEPISINGWSPRNSSGANRGEMTLRTAFAYSVNTIAAKLGQEVGFGTIADMARRFGITTKVDTHPAMVLGTSDVRLLDMTRAFASVANKGVAVTPYGITKVTANGETIYAQQVDRSHVLVAPYVAAQMTDLLQTAVSTGTGKAAQIGRPVAGKTGTTTSNKDGWFLGFSSGLTTGVWMGRDDAKVVPGLQGGTAPARAFAAFMKPAVANRPVEAFETQVTLPEWQLEPDQESYFGEPDNGLFVDEDGNPVEPGTAQPTDPGPPLVDPDGNPLPPDQQERAARSARPEARPERLDQEWMDQVLGRTPPPGRPAPQRSPAVPPSDRPAERASGSAPNPVKRRAIGAQPCPRSCRVALVQLFDQRVEFRPVIHMDSVRDLMRDGGPPHEIGRQDQPPAIADRAARGATAPAPRGSPIATLVTPTPARAANSAVSALNTRSASRLSQVSIRRDSPSRGPPQRRIAPSRSIRRGAPSCHAIVRRSSPNGTTPPGTSGRGRGRRARCAAIQACCPSAQSKAGLTGARNGSVSRTRPLAGSTESLARRARALRTTSTGPEPESLTGGDRPDDIPGRRHRPRRWSSRAPIRRRGERHRDRRRRDNASAAAARPPRAGGRRRLRAASRSPGHCRGSGGRTR